MDANPFPRRMATRLAVGLTAIFVLFAADVYSPMLEAIRAIAVGWWRYPWRTWSRVAVSRPGLVTAALCLAVFTVGLHGFLRWLHRGLGGLDARWRPRWTVSIVGLIVLMFAAGISTVGITHQAGWLLTSPHALVVSRADLGWKSGSTLTQLALGFHNYESAYGALPSNVGDPPLHSWQAKMLPFVGQRVDAIDFSRSWDDPRNTAAMRGVVSVYLNPRVGVIRDARGYALSHHVGNVHVFGVGGPQTFDDVPGGLSQTMMAGEVASGFKPWGDPSNLRDPLLPFDGSPRAFGSPEGGGANVLMMDGSVKFVSDHADPKVLRVLSGVRD